ncbi:uncharacterized protein LOC128801764 isoform X1 [Vidua chalybeata]|uniref:uncharacterized protein LOC128801761 isoform X1 n=1 Tax=Vidua chalybeata TaxID=81927 RepID=UPI0023A7F22D|nr:uncharacterized protein LOC128801761 isoform X1 [Vidua chalybeata]XP_053823848.1 uncharacterized protein LOC128801761 isoform X1 [Vidua chalybeata]XP_053823857.1 uncharacterized protein LOC128801764 isoform X1 [Vidua chalybeata]
MVLTRSKSVVGTGVCDQVKPSKKDVSVQTHSCLKCLSLSVASGGVVKEGCLPCEQVNDLLSLVAELREEVERLRSIRDSEREIDWWSSALTSLREAHQESEGSYVSHSQAIEGHLVDEGEWKWVPARGGNNKNPSCPPSPSQLPLQNRYEALDLDSQTDDLEENYLPSEPPNYDSSKKSITTSNVKKKRRVIVVGDSLLRGTEGPVCRPDPSHREVCCLSGAQVRNITERLPRLIRSSDYYPLLILQAGSDEIEKRSVKVIKREFRALGQVVDRTGVQVVFCSVPLVAEKNNERNRKTHFINKWLKGWCYRQNFGFFDHGATFMAPALLESDGIHLSVKGRRFLAHELADLIERALN